MRIDGENRHAFSALVVGAGVMAGFLYVKNRQYNAGSAAAPDTTPTMQAGTYTGPGTGAVPVPKTAGGVAALQDTLHNDIKNGLGNPQVNQDQYRGVTLADVAPNSWLALTRGGG